MLVSAPLLDLSPPKLISISEYIGIQAMLSFLRTAMYPIPDILVMVVATMNILWTDCMFAGSSDN